MKNRVRKNIIMVLLISTIVFPVGCKKKVVDYNAPLSKFEKSITRVWRVGGVRHTDKNWTIHGVSAIRMLSFGDSRGIFNQNFIYSPVSEPNTKFSYGYAGRFKFEIEKEYPTGLIEGYIYIEFDRKYTDVKNYQMLDKPMQRVLPFLYSDLGSYGGRILMIGDKDNMSISEMNKLPANHNDKHHYQPWDIN